MELIMQYLVNLWDLFIDMSFYIVIGILFTGILHAFVKKDIILKQIGNEGFASVVKAAIFGVPLPLCSCGVVPTAMYLGKSGASKGAVVSFLTSTPQTGVDSIIATYGLMGPVFAAYRAIAAFFSGIFAGTVTSILCKNDEVKFDDAPTSCGCCGGSEEHEEVAEEEHCCCGSHAEPVVEEEHCCCGSHAEPVVEEHCCCGSHAEPVVEEEHCCCGSHAEPAKAEATCGCGCESGESPADLALPFSAKLKSVFTYGFGDFLDEIAKNFTVGLLIAAAISTLIPESFLSYFTNPLASMLLMLVIGIPMYVCSTASIPIAVSLIMKGVSPGAAFVFLFAGPVTNVTSLVILKKTLGNKVMGIYLGSVAFCSIAFGLLFDYMLETISGGGINDVIAHVHGEETPIYMVVVAVIFGLLVIRSLVRTQMKKQSSESHSCCG